MYAISPTSCAKVNLTGSEGRLAYEMEQLVRQSANPNLRYEAFDFHKECGHNNWGRLNVLMDRLDADQTQFGLVIVLVSVLVSASVLVSVSTSVRYN